LKLQKVIETACEQLYENNLSVREYLSEDKRTHKDSAEWIVLKQ
jgi:hypothetical protein